MQSVSKTMTNDLRHSFFEATAKPFSLYDKNLVLIDTNKATLEMFNFKRDKIIGECIHSIYPEFRRPDSLNICREVLFNGKPAIIEQRIADNKKSHRWLNLELFKLEDKLGIISTDITEFKNRIEELNSFIYKSSHDMRSPLTSIKGLICVAGNEVNNHDATSSYLSLIKHQAERLDEILLKNLETTKIVRGKKTNEPIDFNLILNEVLGSLAYTHGFDDLKIETEVAEIKKFVSDKFLIMSIFQNLIIPLLK
jgi:PAS domain S-box-containing protein